VHLASVPASGSARAHRPFPRDPRTAPHRPAPYRPAPARRPPPQRAPSGRLRVPAAPLRPRRPPPRRLRTRPRGRWGVHPPP